MPATIAARDRLTWEEVHAVTELVDRVAAADGVDPLSEHVMLHVTHGRDSLAYNLLLFLDDVLIGYAHLDLADVVQGPSGEVLVHPDHRQRGFGEQLVHELETIAARDMAQRPLQLWAHGQSDAARSLARKSGFEEARVLKRMSRSLDADLPPPEFPPNVQVRTFVVGSDESAWLRLNARAFAHLPDQGRWTREDLLLRERQPWFDPQGFFLAEHDSQLVGFHWTKTHGAHADEPEHPHAAVGEVYVVAVDPDSAGIGLGKALTLQGLQYMRNRDIRSVFLYVDAANHPAIRLYASLGFELVSVDVSYRKPTA